VRRCRKSSTALMACLSAGLVLTACWLPQPAPLPGAQVFQSNFFGLACPSATYCVAAGTYAQPANVGGQPLPFFDVLASDHWTSITPPLPSNADGSVANITSVSCISVGSCIAVGNYEVSLGDTQGLIETLANGSWTGTQAPLPSDASSREQGVQLTSVSCGSDGTCASIGQYTGPDIETPSSVIETLSGGTWTAMAPPLPSDAGVPFLTMLSGVSCASGIACAVVGSYSGPSGGALIDFLSSGQWVGIDAPSVTGFATVNAVSCIASGDCTVVGSEGPLGPGGPGSTGLIDTLSRAAWNASVAPIPSDGNGTVGFTSVSCAPDDSCAAVGDYATSAANYVPFADSRVGGVWNPNVIPLPSNSVNSMNVQFPGPVSCAAGLNCTVLGSYYSAVGGRTFGYIASTSGEAWSSQPAPLPAGAGANSSGLGLVSCPSSVVCFAFGSYGTNSGATAIIETGFKLKLPGFSVTSAEAGASVALIHR
jgi:hypothetical protein